MNKYLEKIAKEYYQKVEEADTRLGSALGGAAVGGFTAHQVNKRFGNVLQKYLVLPMVHQAPTAPVDVMQRVVEETLPRTNTVLGIMEAGGDPAVARAYRSIADSAGPHFATHQSLNSMQSTMHKLHRVQDLVNRAASKITGKQIGEPYDNAFAGKGTFNKNYVHLGGVRNTDILAHELGHAVDFTTGNTKLKRGISQIGRRIHGIPSAALGGLALTNEKTRDYAWTVPLLAAAPTLREEAAANIHAAKLVRSAGGNAKLLRGLFGRNLVSYSIPALAAAGALAGVNKLRKDGEKVDPDEWLTGRD